MLFNSLLFFSHFSNLFIALDNTKMSECSGGDFVKLSMETDGKTAYMLMQESGVVEAYVVEGTDKFIGKISLFEAITADDEPINKHLQHEPFTLNDSDSLAVAMNKITNFVGESIPVLSSDTNVLRAVVTEGNIFQAVLDVQDNVKKIERN